MAKRPRPLSVDSLAGALFDLGWPEGAVGTFESRRASGLRVGRPDRPRVIVVDGGGHRDLAASVGYSGESRYTLHRESNVFRLFSSTKWRTFPGDSPILETEIGDKVGAAQLLELLSPDAPEVGPAAKTAVPRPALAELLGRALAELRAQAFEAALWNDGDAEGRDLPVLRTFHKLLYVRFHEDRWGPVGNATIRALVEESNIGAAIDDLLAQYTSLLDSQLFEAPGIAVNDLPAGTVRSLVKQLTEPWAALHLDFSVTEAGIASRLYEHALEHIPSRSNELQLLPSAEERSERTKLGAYYTPPGLAVDVTTRTLLPWLRRRQPAAFSDVRVVDPTCGSGSFLIAAYRTLADYFAGQFGRRLSPDERAELLQDSLFGADKDPQALLIARAQLLEAADLGPRRLPELVGNLLVGDSLASPPDAPPQGGVDWAALVADKAFDVVLSNPPFAGEAGLARQWAASEVKHARDTYPLFDEKRADIAAAFVDLGLRLLAPDGAAGFVLPRSTVTAAAGAAVRNALSAWVTDIVDYRGTQLFSAASYVATVTIDVGAPGPKVTVSEAVSAHETHEAAMSGLDVRGSMQTIDVDRDTLARAPSWSGFDARWTSLASLIGVRTSPLADSDWVVMQGTQTSANKALTLPAAEVQIGEETAFIGGIEVDARRVPLFVKSGDILPWLIRPTDRHLFLPFDRPAVLGELSPAVLNVMANRGAQPKNMQPGTRLDLLLSPKVLVRPLGREPAAAVDPNGSVITIKGTGGGLAITKPDVQEWELDAVAALLNSSLYQWLLLRGGDPKADDSVEIRQAELEALPWPALKKTGWRKVAAAGRAAARALTAGDVSARARAFAEKRAELDELVFELLRVGGELRDIVEREIVRVA